MPLLASELVLAWDGEAWGLPGLSGSRGPSDPGDLILGLTLLLLQCVTPGKLLPLSGPGSPHLSNGTATISSTAYMGFQENKVTLIWKEYIHLELFRGFFSKKSERVLVISNPSALKCLLGAGVVCLPYRKLGVKNVIHCFSIKLFSKLVLLFLTWEKLEVAPIHRLGLEEPQEKLGNMREGWGGPRVGE